MKTHKLTQTQLLYKELCEEEKTIPLWQQFWWFEAICPGQWEVLLVEENGKIMAALPYHFRTKLGMKFILQPQLTQATGPWLRATEKTESNQDYSFVVGDRRKSPECRSGLCNN